MLANEERARAKRLGQEAENLACRYLEAKGWRILDRNYRSRYGEIDIVCQDGTTLVFIEVRSRASDAMVSPAESVTRAKIRRLSLTVRDYIYKRKVDDRTQVRFDVLSIQGSVICEIQSALEF